MCHCRLRRRGEKKQGRRLIGRKNGGNFSQFGKVHLLTDPSSSVKFKQDKHKATCRHIVVKMIKAKLDDKHLKAIREGKDDIFRGTKI